MTPDEVTELVRKVLAEHGELRQKPCPGCGRCPVCGYTPHVNWTYPWVWRDGTWVYDTTAGNGDTVYVSNGTKVES